MTNPTHSRPTAELARFASELQFDAIPAPVVRRAEDLCVDWWGSTLAGGPAPAVTRLRAFAQAMGGQGPCEVFANGAMLTPWAAALANAAAAHVVEQDDVHNGSVFHPAAVVFPAVWAAGQALGASGRQVLTAAVAGYEVGIRVGEALGRSHYKIFHTTATAGTFAAAAGVGRLLHLGPQAMLHAFGSAGTQSAGLWEFLRDAADSKQLHTAHAATSGLMAAYLAKDGFTGASAVIEGAQGLARGTSTDADFTKLVDQLGSRWCTAETSFKFHASCRHTHPAADALLQVMQQHHLTAANIDRVIARVHQGAIDVLGPVIDPRTVHQSKFSMGTVLGLIAFFGRAGLAEFDTAFQQPEVKAFCTKVSMVLDTEVDQAYPSRWIGKVQVHTTDGRVLHGRVDTPKGDPDNTLSRAELRAKALALAQYGGFNASLAQQRIDQLFQLSHWARLDPLVLEARIELACQA